MILQDTRIILPVEKPFLLQMPSVLPFLTSSDSKANKEAYRKILENEASNRTQAITQPNVPQNIVQQRQIPPPLTIQSSSSFTQPSQSQMKQQTSQQQQQSSTAPMTSNQQSKPPTLLIPDTLPPTPIIGVGTGIMGILCVTRSGRIFIRIGENKFWVQNGAECTGAQHLIYMDKDRKSVADFGDVTLRLVCVPDIDNLGIK